MPGLNSLGAWGAQGAGLRPLVLPAPPSLGTVTAAAPAVAATAQSKEDACLHPPPSASWLAGSLLAAVALRRGSSCVGRRDLQQRHRVSSCRRAGSSAVASAPPRLEETLADAFKGCLETLGTSSGGSSASSRSARWSVEEEDETCDGSAYYSRFRVEKIPARQGRTLGNTLRRTLLRQDLFRSVAAVAFRVRHRPFNVDNGRVYVNRAEPALHEYAAVPGVHEHMLDVVRNVQQLAVAEAPQKAPADLPLAAMASNSPEPDSWRWAARRCGPCAVQARDFDMVDSSTFYERPAVLPLPSQHLLKITAPAMVEVEVEATCCSQREWDESPAFDRYKKRLRFDGWLIVPPLFSPVRKVNYLVTTSEESPDEEVVQLEVWTSKAARPSDLLRTSAATMLGGLAARASQQDSADDQVTSSQEELPQESDPGGGRIPWSGIVTGDALPQEVTSAVKTLEGQIEGSEQKVADDDLMEKSGLDELLEGALQNPEMVQSGEDELQAGMKGLTDGLFDV
eukprot:gb/GFBE01026688.1/.p1 GENE.gb/GFBE01026688.1/~~gb/GFBE01026688.1/.p1  ORF type:complete len:511 (+),score=113.04 gb/GFBE01026688.1/:1-1533(+)